MSVVRRRCKMILNFDHAAPVNVCATIYMRALTTQNRLWLWDFHCRWFIQRQWKSNCEKRTPRCLSANPSIPSRYRLPAIIISVLRKWVSNGWCVSSASNYWGCCPHLITQSVLNILHTHIHKEIYDMSNMRQTLEDTEVKKIRGSLQFQLLKRYKALPICIWFNTFCNNFILRSKPSTLCNFCFNA